MMTLLLLLMMIKLMIKVILEQSSYLALVQQYRILELNWSLGNKFDVVGGHEDGCLVVRLGLLVVEGDRIATVVGDVLLGTRAEQLKEFQLNLISLVGELPKHIKTSIAPLESQARPVSNIITVVSSFTICYKTRVGLY